MSTKNMLKNSTKYVINKKFKLVIQENYEIKKTLR